MDQRTSWPDSAVQFMLFGDEERGGQSMASLIKGHYRNFLILRKSFDILNREGVDLIINSRDIDSPVGISSYLVIKKFIDAQEQSPNGIFFNKAMSLLDRELRKDGVDIHLPHCWYRWGDEVVRILMPREIEWNHESTYHTSINWNTKARPFDDSGLMKKIESYVDTIIAEYATESIDDVIEEVYSYAPFDFQRKFRICRQAIGDCLHSPIEWKDSSGKVLMPYYKSACESFPKEEFPIVAKHLPVFERIMEYLLTRKDRYEANCILANEISEEFWFWFCYFLRIHKKAHENIPDSTIEYWASRIENETIRYERFIGDHLLQLTENDSSLKNDSILLPIIESRRLASLEENEILTDFVKEIQGLDESHCNIIIKPYVR